MFRPNDEADWSQLWLVATNVLSRVGREGALQGSRPDQAFFGHCNPTTMTQADRAADRMVCEVGVAAVLPAEFIVFRVQQWTGSRT